LILKQAEEGATVAEVCRKANADRLWAATVEQRRNLRVGIDRYEAAAELIAISDLDQPGIVFGAGVTNGQQLQIRGVHHTTQSRHGPIMRQLPDPLARPELMNRSKRGDWPRHHRTLAV
jgi:hypothetical protein